MHRNDQDVCSCDQRQLEHHAVPSPADSRPLSINSYYGGVRLRQLRISKCESQEKFWRRFGVTQSTGSRFENGMPVPPPVAKLVKMYFSGTINDQDLVD